jgi:hypothetical protein
MNNLTWYKSSYSGGGGQDCIEIANEPATVHIRDSKNTTGPIVDVAPAPWQVFVAYAAADRRSR